MTEEQQLQSVPVDALSRDAFLTSLEKHIAAIAATKPEQLPAPRVLAVDAPWGVGKSWLATSLHARLRSANPDVPVAFIDAFRHDHHHEVFPVMAAAIMQALKPKAEQKRKFLAATGAVLKVGLPATAKLIAGAAAKKLGAESDELGDLVDKVKGAIDDGAGTWSNSAVDAMLKRFASTQATQEAFIETLGDLARPLPAPFVVLIDELDRCRPSFALEVLEQIKHLFAAPNVVFVLFWNAASISESIRHTYGPNIDALAYLGKFVSLSIPLTGDSAPSRDYGRYGGLITKMINRNVLGREADEVATAVGLFAEVFDATVRDVQRALHSLDLVLTGIQARGLSLPDLVFVVVLRSVNEASFRNVGSQDPGTLRRIAEALFPYRDRRACKIVWAHCMFLADKARYQKMARDKNAFAGATDVEKLVVEACGHDASASDLLDQAARTLSQALTMRVK